MLVVVLRETQLMRRGSLPARPRGRLREGRPSLTPAAREFLRPIRLALQLRHVCPSLLDWLIRRRFQPKSKL